LAKGYTLAHVDGLNRYYLADAHEELKEAFRFGPNFFDGFQLAESSWSTGLINQRYEEKLAGIDRQRTEIESQLAALRETLARGEAGAAEREGRLREEAEQKLEAARNLEAALRADLARQAGQTAIVAAAIAQMRRTVSWRLTAPLRKLAAIFGQQTNDSASRHSTGIPISAPEPESLMPPLDSAWPAESIPVQANIVSPAMLPATHIDEMPAATTLEELLSFTMQPSSCVCRTFSVANPIRGPVITARSAAAPPPPDPGRCACRRKAGRMGHAHRSRQSHPALQVLNRLVTGPCCAGQD
jgi:hypothetical protein